MILTRKQEEGLRISINRYRAGESYTCVAGYAGTGKSTLVNYVVAALQVNPDKVAYVAFTGKAAQVLKEKGCKNAKTAHKLLYKARPMPDGTYIFSPRDVLEEDYELIIVDEVSMLPKSLWTLLLSHGIHVIALGDPGQLPTINPDEDNHILDKPHVFLDEIMRQAAESEIIRYSMWIREGKPLDEFPCENKEVMRFSRNQLDTGMLSWADQILCATNETRNYLNNTVRSSLGFGPEPCVGDKIISLKNHWDRLSNSGDFALTNGLIGTITDFAKQAHYPPLYVHKGPIQYMYTDINLGDDDAFFHLPIDYTCLKSGKPELTPREIFTLSKCKQYHHPIPMDFAYGYAITTHKAQGSQWSKVLVVEENFPFSKEDHRRWCYTAATRAIDKLVMITK